MVDRKARAELVSTIDAFLSRKIKAFEFDDRQTRIAAATKDKTVRHASTRVWFYYDDLINHEVNLSKEQWDYFQRLRLLLQSQAEWCEVKGKWRWGLPQILAWCSLFFLSIVIWKWGIGWEFLVAEASVAIVWFALFGLSPARSVEEPRIAQCLPFESWMQLRRIRTATPQFVKFGYPLNASRQPLRTRENAIMMYVVPIPASLIFMPFILPFAAVPRRHVLRFIALEEIPNPNRF